MPVTSITNGIRTMLASAIALAVAAAAAQDAGRDAGGRATQGAVAERPAAPSALRSVPAETTAAAVADKSGKKLFLALR